MAEELPQVYKATYSGVPVYEYTVRNVAVMRRRADGWMNATQILKVADFDKPQRTRILEREVQQGTHEKVQGGYGKYQGTWVPIERGRELATQYRVEELLLPILNYQPTAQSPPQAPRHITASSRGSRLGSIRSSAASRRSSQAYSEPASPAARKDSVLSTTSSVGRQQNFPNSSPSLASPLSMPPRGRGRPSNASKLASATGSTGTVNNTKPRARKGRKPGRPARTSASGSQFVSLTTSAHQYGLQDIDMTTAPSEASMSSAALSSASESPTDDDDDSPIGARAENGGSLSNSNSLTTMLPPGVPPSHRPGGGSLIMSSELGPQSSFHHARRPSQMSQVEAHTVAPDYSNKLLDYFMAPDDENVPEFLINPPVDFDVNGVIDDEGHTAFHWACAMGHLRVIEILLRGGADITAVNYLGQTPLIRAILFTNNYDRRTFPKLVDTLKSTIFHLDRYHQTVFHHIASTTSTKSKLSAARYYIDVLMGKLSESHPLETLAEALDQQDAQGDTPLLIAARNGARKVVKTLLTYNASPDIPNKTGRLARDYIYEHESQRHAAQAAVAAHAAASARSVPKSSSSPLPSGFLDNQSTGGGGYESVNNNGYLNDDSSAELGKSRPPPRRHYDHYQGGQSPDYSNNTTDGIADHRLMNGTHSQNNASGEANKNANGNNNMLITRSRSDDDNSNNNKNRNGWQSIPSFVNQTHISETAIKACQKVIPTMAEYLNELANAYDAELREKEADLEQGRQLLESMKQELMQCDGLNDSLKQQIGDGRMMAVKLEHSQKLVEARSLQLKKVVERTQARDLAGLVRKEELDVQDQIEAALDEDETTSEQEQIRTKLAQRLTELQAERVRKVDEIVELWSGAGVGEKMSDYRRLISISCGVKIAEIDNLLDGISQALSGDSDSVNFVEG